MKTKFKKDGFSNARGSYSKLLDIHCRKCNSLILTYQKDGPGNLYRLYLDRIFSPEKLVNLKNMGLKQIKNLECVNCGELLGTPAIYDKEKRKAFRLYSDAVVKKQRKLNLWSYFNFFSKISLAVLKSALLFVFCITCPIKKLIAFDSPDL